MKKLNSVERSFVLFLIAVVFQLVLCVARIGNYELVQHTPVSTISVILAVLSVLAGLWFGKCCIDKGNQLGVFNKADHVEN